MDNKIKVIMVYNFELADIFDGVKSIGGKNYNEMITQLLVRTIFNFAKIFLNWNVGEVYERKTMKLLFYALNLQHYYYY